MQYLLYPTKTMSISQNYNEKFSHYNNSHGTPKDFPIDESCGDSKRDYFYAPCDLTIKRIYGVGNKGTNTIWLQSKGRVKIANGMEKNITIMVIHPNDDTLKKLKVGQSFKQGEKMFLEGKDGHATGYHFHISVATAKFSELKNGWVQNNKGAWVITKNAIKPEEAFWVDTSFTKIKNKRGLKFKTIKTNKTTVNKVKVSYYPKSSYKGDSIAKALSELKINNSYAYRSKIALKNGIKNYQGTAEQNTKMLNLLKQGKLKKV